MTCGGQIEETQLCATQLVHSLARGPVQVLFGLGLWLGLGLGLRWVTCGFYSDEAREGHLQSPWQG